MEWTRRHPIAGSTVFALDMTLGWFAVFLPLERFGFGKRLSWKPIFASAPVILVGLFFVMLYATRKTLRQK